MSFLQDFNNAIDNVIFETKNDKYLQNQNFYNFIRDSMEMICNKVCYYDENPNLEIPVIHEDELFETILDFFKSIDIDFYDKTYNILNNKYPNIEAYIYDFHKIEVPSYIPNYYHVDFSEVITKVYLPLGYELTKEKAEEIEHKYGKDFYTIDDLYSITHEIAHFLDKKTNKITGKITSTADILAETTPIIFENLLTDYLLKKETFNKNSIINKKNKQNNLFMNHAHLTRLMLLFSEIKKSNGIITKNDIEHIMKNEKISKTRFNYLIKIIPYSDTCVTTGKRYAFSAFYCPIIAEKIRISNSSNLLKKYLHEVSENVPFTDILKSFGIDIKKDIKKFKEEDEYIR